MMVVVVSHNVGWPRRRRRRRRRHDGSNSNNNDDMIGLNIKRNKLYQNGRP
jgi:hypothetical protein